MIIRFILEFKVSDNMAKKLEQKILLLTSFSSLNTGSSICMGGYEENPILLDRIPNDFHFGLYELDYSVFDTHIEGAVKLCPQFGNAGIKSTICGPESFTPDHKPLMVIKLRSFKANTHAQYSTLLNILPQFLPLAFLFNSLIMIDINRPAFISQGTRSASLWAFPQLRF